MDNYIDIDLQRLHEEWAVLPKEHRKLALEVSDAKMDLKELEAHLRLVEAELSVSIRSSPEKYLPPDTKIREDLISSTILLQPEYQRALEKVHRMRREVGQLDALLSSLESRKTALENEVKLWLGSYFSVPKVTGADKERLQQKKKQDARGRSS